LVTLLDLHGRGELAESFWRHAAYSGPFQDPTARFRGRGWRSSLGLERGRMPDEFAKQEAEAAKAADEAAAKEPPEDKAI
jgi:hypothetical protein